MRPDPARVLMGVATNLLVNLTPEVRTPFGQSVAGMAGMLAIVLAQEVDRLADRLHRETEVVAAILADALPLLDAALATRVQAAVDGRVAPDLRVSSLQVANDRVRAALIDVHAAVEAIDSPEARAMDTRIWDELRESTRRRHVEVPR
jgi:hypothetical protein